jgi:hypothetical protein
MLNAPINSQIGSYQLTVNSKSAALYYSLIIPNKLQSKNPQDIKRSTLKGFRTEKTFKDNQGNI